MNKGRLFVISGPSGVGKGTIVKKILETEHPVELSVSATTRAPREGEEEGRDYFFVTNEEFEERIANKGFLEYAHVHEHYYGTPKAPVEKALSEGKDIILEIDVQGAMQVRESFDDGVYIFILPPSIDVLRDRIMGRGTETEHSLEVRLGKALEEIRYTGKYDYSVVNDDLEKATDDVLGIMKAEHFRILDAEEIIGKYEEETK